MSGSLAAVTPAFDEVDRLPALIDSMARQTVRPVRWVIVDDGSSDGTYEAAVAATAGLDFVTVVERTDQPDRSFASKVRAIDRAVGLLEGESFEFLGCFDADVVLPETYVEQILTAFGSDPTLGVTGGLYRQWIGDRLVVERGTPEHVPGAAQVFRRETFEAVGGYQGMPFGGEDALICVAARMHGWTTRSRPDLVVDHARRMGTGGDLHPVAAEYRKGRQDWDVGAHPWFEAGKLTKRVTRRPVVIGSLARLLGYLRGAVGRVRHAPDDVVAFLRREQLDRIRARFGR